MLNNDRFLEVLSRTVTVILAVQIGFYAGLVCMEKTAQLVIVDMLTAVKKDFINYELDKDSESARRLREWSKS